MQSRIPTLADIILSAIERRVMRIETAEIGSVVEYDPASMTASIQPFASESSPAQPVGAGISEQSIAPTVRTQLHGVPVCWPYGQAGSGYAVVTFPIATGSPGIILYCKYSVRDWQLSGQPHEGEMSDGVFGPNGSVFFPGCIPMPIANVLSSVVDPTCWQLTTPLASVKINATTGAVDIASQLAVTIDAPAIKQGIGATDFAAKGTALYGKLVELLQIMSSIPATTVAGAVNPDYLKDLNLFRASLSQFLSAKVMVE